jgi:8-oxo-dGTP diphosphatase
MSILKFLKRTSMSNAPRPQTIVCRDIDGKPYDVPLEQLQWRPAAYAIVVHDGKLLVTKQLGVFHLPGGGAELGEYREDAVIREVREETGIEVANPRPTTFRDNFFKFSGGGEFVHSVLLFYICDFVGGEFSIDGFDEWEKEFGDMPEWLPLADLNTIKIRSSVDWPAIVREALQLK